jgi:TonB family protein
MVARFDFHGAMLDVRADADPSLKKRRIELEYQLPRCDLSAGLLTHAILEDGSEVPIERVKLPVVDPATKSKPVYPEIPRLAGIEAVVVLSGIVTASGEYENACVLMGTNPPDLGFEEAAFAAVINWQFEPGRVDDQPVDVYFSVTVRFDLQ